jgi:hypothetical protein
MPGKLIIAMLGIILLAGCSFMSPIKVPADAQLVAYGAGGTLHVPTMKEAGTYYVYDDISNQVVIVAYMPDGTGLSLSGIHPARDYRVYFVPASATRPAASSAK